MRLYRREKDLASGTTLVGIVDLALKRGRNCAAGRSLRGLGRYEAKWIARQAAAAKWL